LQIYKVARFKTINTTQNREIIAQRNTDFGHIRIGKQVAQLFYKSDFIDAKEVTFGIGRELYERHFIGTALAKRGFGLCIDTQYTVLSQDLYSLSRLINCIYNVYSTSKALNGKLIYRGFIYRYVTIM
jgi:hypothetical protein